MNQYAQRLRDLQERPSHKLKEIGDQWQTPKPLAWGLFHHFAPKIGPVVLDLFADMSNALVGCFYTAADNAMTQDWAGDSRRQGGACYGNPPYSRPEFDEKGNPITGMESILAYCREQRDLGAKIMLLIKAATSDGWWPEDADFIQFISGRIGFEAPNWYTPADPVKDKPSSSGFASAVVIFDRDWKWERRPIERLNRDDLITTGEIILGMIDLRAAQMVSQLRGSVHMQSTAASTETVDNTREEAPGVDLSQDLDSEDLDNTPAGGSSVQLDMLDANHDAGNDPEPAGLMSLSDWYWEYMNCERLSLDDGQWPRFVVVLTILYGIRESYTSRQVAIACSICDEQLMDDYTTLSDEMKEQIRRCSMVMNKAEQGNPMSDEQRQAAITALLDCIDDKNLSLHDAEIIARRASCSISAHEVAA